ncbi:MAG TPA: FHA domain-containing protein [Polyangiaceae bacterium]|nr:FHA domain-containing protein [Polyangiaceae bacterium]
MDERKGRGHYEMARRLSRLLSVLVVAALALAFGGDAAAAPEAHILRIDPRTGLSGGKPTLTTVIEVVQFKRLSDVLQPCAGATAAATLSCWSEQLEKPGALWDPFPLPEQNAHFLVKVSGEDQLTKFVDKTAWGKAQNQPNVGTAWLVAVDASSGMGTRFGDARAIAHEFIEEMQPNDLMDLMFFDDVQVVRDTKWKTFKQRADLGNALNDFKSTSPSHGRDRALFSQIKTMTQDAFGSLGNSDQPDAVPLHQAMVVLSNGAGRGDAESASPSADVFHQYLDQGRFPADNTSLPKTPLPVISIWLPNGQGLMENIYRNNEAQFMQSLANPEIGGFFDIIQQGMGAAKAKTVIGLVRARFNAMWLVHWTMSCLNSSVEQTFNLVFENTHPTIAPDGTFKDVPIGMDPTQWPLDVDSAKTLKAAQDNPVYPGGQFTVYGDFCWSGDKTRAEAYFIPAGTKPNSQTNSRDPEVAKKAMQQLQAEHMLGTAVAAGDGYVTFNVPDDDKVLDGSGDNTVARLVVYDNKAHRASAVDEKSVLSLKATKKPLSLPLIGGIAGLLIVIVLLVLVLLRGGGGGKKRGGAPPPGPMAPPGYGPPPGGGYGGAPPGGGGYAPPGGYGMHSMADPLAATAAAPGGAAAMGYGAPAGFGVPPPQQALAPPPAEPWGTTAAPPVVQVRCPACGMNTMATPGQPSFCFSCGQPIGSEVTKGGGGVSVPGFPVTGPMNAQPVSPAAPQGWLAATIRGTAGQFSVQAGSEVRVGRDPAQCPIFLSEPRVSGVHATLRLADGQLMVRDETSNNGTWVSGMRIVPGIWTAVPAGAPLRFGPVEFTVQVGA